MNERVMQFRIGLFVIVAGLVLTMLIVWFGESPVLFRDRVYVVARYDEAPGVAEGIMVRKNGIRVGEVTAIAFDDRPNQPDGVLVTIALDRKFKIKAGTVPRVNRTLIGDVSIDLLPGTGTGPLTEATAPHGAPIIEGVVTPDPAKALAAATVALDKAGGVLESIQKAADGLSTISSSADDVKVLLATWKATGQRVSAAADGIDRFIKTNENEVQPAIASMREVATKLNSTLDAKTQQSLKSGIDQFATAANQLSQGMTNAAPFLRDLGGSVSASPSTDFGQVVRRLNLMTADMSLLTAALRGPDGRLSTQGSLQRMLSRPELYENINHFAVSGNAAFDGLKPILSSFKVFAEKIARDPSAIAKGALAR
jgi:phospholipid/cholesterol/gamma-HCH transport system substrate-binding protein